jgi:hypothetical protein
MRVRSLSIMGAPVNMDSEHAAVRTSHQSDGVKVYCYIFCLRSSFFALLHTWIRSTLRFALFTRATVSRCMMIFFFGGCLQ